MIIKHAASGLAVLEVLRGDEAHFPLIKDAHRVEFQYKPRKGYLYVRSRAISSRTNDNFDTFPAEELRQAWATFIGKPVFVNHHNHDHTRMRGVVIDAALHNDKGPDGTDDTWVEVLMEVDARKFPKLAAALIKREIERTSMGCDVITSECSYCGNVARVPDDYCPHVQRMKGQRLRRKGANGEVEDVLVHEICRGLHFFENSLLVEDPADPTAVMFGLDVTGVLNEGDDIAALAAKTAAADTRKVEASSVAARGFGASIPEIGRPAIDMIRRMSRGEATIDDLILVVSDKGHVGDQWAIEDVGDYWKGWGDPGGDAEDYAWTDDDTTVKGWIERTVDGGWSATDDEIWEELGDNLGEIQVVLVGKTDAQYENPEWDAAIPSGSKITLDHIRYDAGWGWKTVNANGRTVLAKAAGKDESVGMDWDLYTEFYALGYMDNANDRPYATDLEGDERRAYDAGWADVSPGVEASVKTAGFGTADTDYVVMEHEDGSATILAGPFPALDYPSDDYEQQQHEIWAVVEANPGSKIMNAEILASTVYTDVRYASKTAGMLDHGPTEPGPDAGTRWEGVVSTASGYSVIALWPGDEAPMLSGIFDDYDRAIEWGIKCREAGARNVDIEDNLTGKMYRQGSKTAAEDFSQERSPAHVETLRMQECPVCGTDAQWNSDGRCNVCGYLPPPRPFQEPDTDIAGRADRSGGWFDPDLTQAAPFVPPSTSAVDGANPVQPPRSATKGQRHDQGDQQMAQNPGKSVAAVARQRMAAAQAPVVPRSAAELAAENARLRAHIASLTRRADTDNPAQPVPEPSAEAPVETTDGARSLPDKTNVDVETPGGVIPDPQSATADVESVGGEIPDPTDGNKEDVEAPVAGTDKVDPAAVQEVQPDTSGETLGDPAFTGDWLNPGADSVPSIGGNASGAPEHSASLRAERARLGRLVNGARDRIWASLHLATLQIRSGIASGDAIDVARQIEASEQSLESIQAQASTLHAVAARAPQRQPAPMPGRTAQRAPRTPSLAAGAMPVVGGLTMHDERDEALFE